MVSSSNNANSSSARDGSERWNHSVCERSSSDDGVPQTMDHNDGVSASSGHGSHTLTTPRPSLG